MSCRGFQELTRGKRHPASRASFIAFLEEGASVTLKAERRDWETKIVKIGGE